STTKRMRFNRRLSRDQALQASQCDYRRRKRTNRACKTAIAQSFLARPADLDFEQALNFLDGNGATPCNGVEPCIAGIVRHIVTNWRAIRLITPIFLIHRANRWLKIEKQALDSQPQCWITLSHPGCHVAIEMRAFGEGQSAADSWLPGTSHVCVSSRATTQLTHLAQWSGYTP